MLNLKKFIKFKNIWLTGLNIKFLFNFLSFIVSILIFPFYINSTFSLATFINNLIATFLGLWFFIPLSILISIISLFYQKFAIYLSEILYF